MDKTKLKFNTAQEKEDYFNNNFFPFLSQLYNYGYYLTRNEEDANDLVQETFIKAFRFIEKFEHGTNYKAWLFKILKNAFINSYRKKASKPKVYSFEDIYERRNDDVDDVDFDIKTPDDSIKQVDSMESYTNQIGDEVTLALNSLQSSHRQIILLADIEDFTYEELSEILDIPIGTVRSRLFRARNLLKDKLMSYGQNRGYKDNRN